MSIRAEIARWVRDGVLFNIEPVIPSDPVNRTMVVSPEIQELLEGPWDSESKERRCKRLGADLEAFVKGDKIGLCLIPYEHATAYMGRLDSPEDEVWDIRSRDPNPGLRVFGRFAEIDTFVALNWDPRSVEWHSRHPLEDRDSLYWHFAIIECQNKWKALFPNDNPIHGKDIHDYVSSNVFSV